MQERGNCIVPVRFLLVVIEAGCPCCRAGCNPQPRPVPGPAPPGRPRTYAHRAWPCAALREFPAPHSPHTRAARCPRQLGAHAGDRVFDTQASIWSCTAPSLANPPAIVFSVAEQKVL